MPVSVGIRCLDLAELVLVDELDSASTETGRSDAAVVYSAVMPAAVMTPVAVMTQTTVLVPRSMMKGQRTHRTEIDDRRRFVCALRVRADVLAVLTTK